MCGEKVQTLLYTDVQKGSPPRMRGKVIVDLVLTERHRIPPHVRGKGGDLSGRVSPDRITPACAGKSGTVGAVGNAIGDHPRMCGEKAAFQRLHLAMLGSPPHVRGKDLQRPRQHRGTGITPACAGKSFCFRSSSVRTWDHPRMCGEKGSRYREQIYSLGSPPHVRGKVSAFALHLSGHGITPACAGKRAVATVNKFIAWDHPRMCGEKSPL